MKAKEYLKTLNLFFYALLIGQLSFVIILLAFSLSGVLQAYSTVSNMYYFIVLLIVAGAYYGGNYFYKIKLKEIRNKKILNEKFKLLQIALILRWSFLEGASMLSLAFFLISSDYLFMIIALAIIFLFYLQRVNKQQIFSDIQLSDEEMALLK